MQSRDSSSQISEALSAIENAFSGRKRPKSLYDSVQLTDHEYADVMSFDSLDWRDVTLDQVEQFGDAVFWFSPEAFCYYLPGIMTAGLKSQRSNLNAIDSIVMTLDRSPNPSYWDEFFLARWPLLSSGEIEAVLSWIDWLEITEPQQVFGNTYDRARDTLRLLKNVSRDAEPT